jgi:hypothetical protein
VAEIGQHRQFEEPGYYAVTFNSKNDEIGRFSVDYSYRLWVLFEQGREYPIEVNYFDKVLTDPVP